MRHATARCERDERGSERDAQMIAAPERAPRAPASISFCGDNVFIFRYF